MMLRERVPTLFLHRWRLDRRRDPTRETVARRPRRGTLLVEVAMAAVLLIIAMTLTVKVLEWVAHERRASDRRERALAEVGNLMERITAYPIEQVTPELAGRMKLTPAALRSLPGSELKVDIAGDRGGDAPEPSSKRIAITLRWRDRSGGWDSPVRLTSWIHARRKGP
jgi:hypothetical protein